MTERKNQIAALLRDNEDKIMAAWIAEQSRYGAGQISQTELKTQCQDFLRLFSDAAQSSDSQDVKAPAWDSTKKMLTEVSKSRALQGFSPTQTAQFIFSLKAPFFQLARDQSGGKGQDYSEQILAVSNVLDQLGLYTFESYQKTRDQVISRQQEEMLELSTPVVKLWDGILALPMIGTLDSSRTQVVMESLLQKIMETGSEVAIIDITGVPTVDTLVAQHLIKTVTAARLMGADCIISGIRPQIAATIVHLGVDLGGVATKASLADAFVLALSKIGKSIGKTGMPVGTHMNRETRV